MLPTMVRTGFVLVSTLLWFTSPVRGTWSVGVIDPRSKTIAVAGASCTNSVYGIAAVVPGIGFVFAQAASNMNAKAEAVRGLRQGRSPAEILKVITDPAFDRRWTTQQYAIMTANQPDMPATFTGGDTPEIRGVRAGKGISVQGNTLVKHEVLQSAFENLYNSKWSDDDGLARAVMGSLVAGSRHGGDKRCGSATASSAFITVVRVGDVGSPYLNLIVRRSDAGDRNAVELLHRQLSRMLGQR